MVWMSRLIAWERWQTQLIGHLELDEWGDPQIIQRLQMDSLSWVLAGL